MQFNAVAMPKQVLLDTCAVLPRGPHFDYRLATAQDDTNLRLGVATIKPDKPHLVKKFLHRLQFKNIVQQQVINEFL